MDRRSRANASERMTMNTDYHNVNHFISLDELIDREYEILEEIVTYPYHSKEAFKREYEKYLICQCDDEYLGRWRDYD